MSGEDQERFEDYLELERYIEDLQAGRAAHPPANLHAAQARIYRMAALFRSASPDAATPRPSFAQELRERLLLLDKDSSSTEASEPLAEDDLQQSSITAHQQTAQEEPTAAARPSPAPTRKHTRSFSRRGMLTGSAVAAASLLVGAGADHLATTTDHTTKTTASTAGYGTLPLVSGPTELHLVTSLASLSKDAVKFTTDNVIGYVIRNDGNNGESTTDAIIAFSAACTHMGCIINWSNTDRQFHCPCHGGAFTSHGTPATGPTHYLNALPRLTVRIIDNNVYVEVPAHHTTQPDDTTYPDTY